MESPMKRPQTRERSLGKKWREISWKEWKSKADEKILCNKMSSVWRETRPKKSGRNSRDDDDRTRRFFGLCLSSCVARDHCQVISFSLSTPFVVVWLTFHQWHCCIPSHMTKIWFCAVLPLAVEESYIGGNISGSCCQGSGMGASCTSCALQHFSLQKVANWLVLFSCIPIWGSDDWKLFGQKVKANHFNEKKNEQNKQKHKNRTMWKLNLLVATNWHCC